MTSQQQIDRLMMPRYEVIADYPNSGFRIGDIIPDALPEWVTDEQKEFTINECKKYPVLFKALQWYEKRKLSELPLYVKDSLGVYKMDKWEFDDPEDEYPLLVMWLHDEIDGYKDWTIQQLQCTPATETEYLSYINKQP